MICFCSSRWLKALILFAFTSLAPLFSSSLASFDEKPEWFSLLGKSRFLSHLIETGDPQTDLIHRTWLENEIALQLQKPEITQSLRHSLNEGDGRLHEAFYDALLQLNLPADYASTQLLLWVLGSDRALQDPLRSFSRAPGVRSRFATYFLQYRPTDSSTARWLQKIGLSTDPYQERELRKRIPHSEKVRWDTFKNYPQLSATAQLEFRWKLFHALNQELESPFSSSLSTPSFAEKIGSILIEKIERNPALRQEYQKRTLTQTLPQHWVQQALLQGIQNQKSDLWFQNYLLAASIPQSRYRATFDSLLQNKQERKTRPELIAESSQERTQWRSRFVDLIQRDPRWSNYLLWHLTRAAEPVSSQLRRSLPSLLAQNETLILQWYRIINPQSDRLPHSQSLKTWGVAWGETLRDNDAEWAKIWSHHHLSHQAILQKTVQATLDENPVFTTTWVHILKGHQAPLLHAFTLWTRQNNPHPEMTRLNPFLTQLAESIQRNEWVGNVNLAIFRTTFSNFLMTPEGWNQISWRIGLETFLIAQPIREFLVEAWISQPQNFWRLHLWRFLFGKENDSKNQFKQWIETEKISEKVLLTSSQQNSPLQIILRSFWRDLFQKNKSLAEALQKKALNPNRQDDLDQALTQISWNAPLDQIIETLLIQGGEAPLIDWILRNSDYQTIWRHEFEQRLLHQPEFLQSVLSTLLSQKIISPISFKKLVQLYTEDRLFIESLLSDPSLGFKNNLNPTLQNL